MRCSKCGRKVRLNTKFCAKCGTVVLPGQKKKSIISFLIWFGVLILLVPIMYLFASHDPNAQNFTIKENFTGALISAVLAFVGLKFVYRLIRYSIRRPVLGIPSLIILVVVPVAIWITIFYPWYSQAKTLARMQNNLAEITAAKLLGNSIINQGKKSNISLDSVQLSVATASGKLIDLSVPEALKNYQAAAILWSIRIASADAQSADWKKLKNQPDAFPLTISNNDAESYFTSSLKTIERLKIQGEEAINNKDREAMRQIAAKLLVQEHWLNAILYSQEQKAVGFLAIPALAASQNIEVPSVGLGVDVTCSVCDYPDAYKVKWTEKLRKQYNCDTRCHAKATTQAQSNTQENTAKNVPTTDDEAAKYAEALASYTYKNVPKRAICIGNNAGGVFCVEEAVSSVNEIAASAIGFADSAKALTTEQWNNEYEEIDLAVLSADKASEIGIAPSQPSAEGGHLEGGMGTIQQGEPTVAPKPAATPTKTSKPASPAPAPKLTTPTTPTKILTGWDGYYDGSLISCNCPDYTYVCRTTVMGYDVGVKNNRAFNNGFLEMGSAPIGEDGYAEINYRQSPSDPSGSNFHVTFQFSRVGDERYVVEDYTQTEAFVGYTRICKYTFKGIWKY